MKPWRHLWKQEGDSSDKLAPVIQASGLDGADLVPIAEKEVLPREIFPLAPTYKQQRIWHAYNSSKREAPMLEASGIKQVLALDITLLPSTIIGQYYYLYIVINV